MSTLQRADWVTVGDFPDIGIVQSVSPDGAFARVKWQSGTKRMPTRNLRVQYTIPLGAGWTVTDEARRREMEGAAQINHCYYCEKPVDRAPYDGGFRICDRCKGRKSRGRSPHTGKRAVPTNIADFWIGKPPDEQAKLAAFYGEPKPLTDEEKQEMEGCGA